MSPEDQTVDVMTVARAIRAACFEAAAAASEDAGMSGLCAEGRLDRALDAIRSLDLEQVLRKDRDDG
jgi:hypothetical protein